MHLYTNIYIYINWGLCVCSTSMETIQLTGVLFCVLCFIGGSIYYEMYTADGGFTTLSFSDGSVLRTMTCCDHLTEIPRVVFQSSNTDVVVRRYMNYRQKITYFNDVEMHVFNHSVMDQYMTSHYLSSVSRAYRKLTKGAMKADLFRLAYVYEYGGIWMDVDTWTRGVFPINYDTDEFVVLIKGWCIETYFFAARANHPVVKQILLKAASNILSDSYSTSRDCRVKDAAGWAGPIVFTNVIHDLLGSRLNVATYRKVYTGVLYNSPYTITIINQNYASRPAVVHKRWFGAEHDIGITFKKNNSWSRTTSY